MPHPDRSCACLAGRHSSGVAMLDLFEIARLDFEPPDLVRFPCLRLAFEAVMAGGTARRC